MFVGYPEGDGPFLYRWGKNKYSQEGSNPLLSMPPADRRRGQRNDAMHRPRRDKNAEAFLNYMEKEARNDYEYRTEK